MSDPFALVRQRLEFDEREDLIVTPEIEDLTGTPDAAFGANVGASRTRNLFRTGEEYHTMRQYHEGDDLRRIHWPSVARTGELMIRQDESSQRANGLVFLDSRDGALGQTHGQAFERAVSVAATLGVLLSRGGFSLRFATADTPPAALSEDGSSRRSRASVIRRCDRSVPRSRTSAPPRRATRRSSWSRRPHSRSSSRR